MTAPSASAQVATATATVLDRPRVGNVYRSLFSEAIVAAALSELTSWSADYAAHDRFRDGVRSEVEQSALRQSWETTGSSRPSWNIVERKAVWDLERAIQSPGRNADIHVLAPHAVADETADRSDAFQASFQGIAATDLLPTRTITLPTARKLAPSIEFEGLDEAVEAIACRLAACHA